jgi:hypothetical protein
MKLLYLSCHSIQEYDDITLLHELGYEVFSAGAYLDPQKPHDQMRPPIPWMTVDQDILEQFHRIGAQHPGKDTKEHLTKEFVDNFDVVIVNHIPQWVPMNWNNMRHKRVIWRTIGQSIAPVEKMMRPFREQGMEIVRYSPIEQTIPGYIGGDAVIRFYKNPDEYGPWNGQVKRVINFTQAMKQRDFACNFTFFEHVTRPFERHLFGPGNEGLTWSTGRVDYDQLKKEMCNNRVYFYTGTHPASYTLNFIEAWMTGIPIVAVGEEVGNPHRYHPGHKMYEIPHLIQNDINGFCSDDPGELQDAIRLLMEDDDYAQEISAAGRKSAIETFGKDKALEAWKKYLG